MVRFLPCARFQRGWSFGTSRRTDVCALLLLPPRAVAAAFLFLPLYYLLIVGLAFDTSRPLSRRDCALIVICTIKRMRVLTFRNDIS